VQLQQQLPGLFQDALSSLNSPIITAAIDHYAAFTAYAHSATADAAASEPSSLLPQLHAVKHSHNTQQLSSDPTQIDSAAVWPTHASSGDGSAVSMNGNEGEIQWDITEAADDTSAAHQSEGNHADEDIDWDVVLEPSTPEPAPDDKGTFLLMTHTVLACMNASMHL